jgi:tRNA A-37 threonylcarbamoyl transferase component Bud32
LYGQLSPPLPPQPPYNHHKGMNNSQSSLDSSSLSTPIDDPRPASLATSISSLVSVRPPIEPISAPQPALPPILWVQITKDGEDFRRCELSHTGPDPSVIRERVCQKFGFKPSETALYITDIDGTPDDAEELDDEALLNACTRGDSKGTLKFLLKAKPAPAPPPPPPPPTRTAPPVGKILIPPPSLRPGGSLLSVPDLNVDGRDSRSISISEDPNRKGHYNITPRELYGVEYGNANASGDSANTTKSGPSDYFDIRSPEPLEPSSEPSNRDSNVPLKKEDVNTRIFEAAERAKENRKGRKRTESDGSEKSTPLDPVPYQFNAETPLMSPTRRRPSAQEETGFEKLGGWKMTHPGRVPTRQASLPMSPSSASSFKVIQKENNDNVVDFSNPRLSPYSTHAPTFESSTVPQTSQHLPTRTNSGIKAQRRAPAPPQFPLLPSRTSTVVATQKFPPDIPKRSQYRRVSDASSLNGRRSSEDERPGSRVPSDGTITLGSSDRSGSVPTIVTPENMNLEPMPLPPKRAPSPNTPGARLGITVDTNIGRPIGDSPPTEWRTSISPYSGYESTPAPDSAATNQTNVTPPPPPEKVSTAPATLPDQFKESSNISFDDAPAFDLPDDDDDESLWAVKPVGVDDSPSQSRRTSESVSPPLGPPVIRKKSSLRKPGRPPSKLTVQIDLKVTEIPTPQFSAIAEESATPTVSSFSISSSAPSDSSSNSSVSRPHHRADSPEYYIGDDRKGLNSPMRVPPSPGTPTSAAFGGSGGTDLTRKNSFAKHEDVWAVRPPPDVVLDNLEEYFPNHDLDKPILVDQGNFSPPSSPMDNSDSDTNNATVKPAAKRPNQQSVTSSPAPFAKPTARMKSIRVVAKEAMEKRSRLANIAKNVKNANLLRRRSTKVWGMRMMEMTPGQLRTGQIVTADSEDKLERRRTFKWVKGELIGKGTYGSVYVGLNATTGEMLAVKQVEVPHSASDRVDERYKQMMDALNAEIETLKDLDHPHIVQYLGYERTETTISIFLEYVPGGSVGRCLKKHGRFEEPVIRSLIRQTLEGLAYLHARGTLHRDLKADNLLLDLDGVCKISDFGISKQSKDVYANDHYTLAGTIFWMAPEVIQSRKEGYSAKIDIWSLGCVVLEMFAGKRPWSTDEAIGAMFKLGNERKAPPIPDDVLEHMSPEAKDFLDKCFTM